MWSWVHKAGSPQTAYRWASMIQRVTVIAFIPLFAYGLWGALLGSPADYQQGDAYRIMYLHVPAAILSLGIYTAMAVAAVFYLVWKIKVADMFIEVAAKQGALFTALTLITGAIWGKPTWGTWWIWDARLTSELILLFIYFGIIALRNAIPERTLAGKATAVLTLIGAVNIPIVHYSVDWWHTLHQGASILKLGSPSIAPSMLHPLLAMIAAFICYMAFVVSQRLRGEIMNREQQARWVKTLRSKP